MSLTVDAAASPTTLVKSAGPADEVSYRPGICVAALLGSDCITALMAASLALEICQYVVPGLSTRTPMPGPAGELALLFGAIIFYLALRGRYHRRTPFWIEARRLSGLSLAAVGVACVGGSLAGGVGLQWSVIGALLLFPPLAMLGTCLARCALARAGVWAMPVVTIGDTESAADAEAAINGEASLGYRIVKTLSPPVVLADRADPSLRGIMDLCGARLALIAVEEGAMQRRIVEAMLRERIPFLVLARPSALPAFAHHSMHFIGHHANVLSFYDGLADPAARAAKLALDVVLASLLLVLTAPWLLLIAAVIRLDGGPALFSHSRIGRKGRRFGCLKFRTMVIDSEKVLREALARDPGLAAEWADTHKLRNDPRITRIGRILRSTSLDELPQLINILRLDMSLVGPRPIVQSEVARYGDGIAQYYATRPGLTGLWQVSGRNNTSYQRRVQLDVWYVNNWTFWLDVVLLAKTIPVVLTREGAV